VIDSLTAGRPLAVLGAPFAGEHLTFGSALLDDQEMADATFKHCTFALVSFKNAIIRHGQFVNCTFVQCYFRRAELISSTFSGCRFIDCNFSHVELKASTFKYSSFDGCQIAFAEFEHAFPAEPNLREELARNLYVQSAALGSSDAGKYRMAAIRAHEKDLKAAIEAKSQWYRDHYDGVGRVRAVFRLGASLLNRWLWGYGERARVLMRNALIASLVVFPIVYGLLGEGLELIGGGRPDVSDLILFSVVTMVPVGIDARVQPLSVLAQVAAVSEALFGLLVIALVASYVFRWSNNR